MAVPTTVEVYRLEVGNVTGSFLGFGSILDPAIVFLHPSTADPDRPDGPVRPIRPGPIRPDRPIRPRPPHAQSELSVAQPVSAQFRQQDLATSAPGGTGTRVRCRITSGDTTRTIDGTVLVAPAGVSVAPTAISLDGAFTGEVDQVTLPYGPGHPTAEETAQVVLSYLQDAALSDPPAPTQPPPLTADKVGFSPRPGRRPWYCVICPGAFGC